MRREIGSWLASPSLLDVQSQRKKAAAQADTNPRKSFLMRHRYLPEEPEDWRRPQQAAAPPVSLIAASLCQELLWTRFTQSGRKRPPSLPLSGMWCCGMYTGRQGPASLCGARIMMQSAKLVTVIRTGPAHVTSPIHASDAQRKGTSRKLQ